MAENKKQEEVESHILHSSRCRLRLGAGMGIREDVVLHLPYGEAGVCLQHEECKSSHPIPFIDSAFDGRE